MAVPGHSSIAAPEGPGDHGGELVHRGGGSLAPELNVLAPLPLGKGRPCSQFPAWHPCNQVSGEELITKWSEKGEKKKKKQNILGMKTICPLTLQRKKTICQNISYEPNAAFKK